MTAASEEGRTVGWGGTEGPLSPSSPTPALERITVVLRHIDTQLAAVKQEVSTDRRLSRSEEVPDLDQVLGPLETLVGTAADTFGLEPAVFDGRRATRGALHIIWADLIDMSPDNLRKRWGVDDIPDGWPELHRQLLLAVEQAIAQLWPPSVLSRGGAAEAPAANIKYDDNGDVADGQLSRSHGTIEAFPGTITTIGEIGPMMFHVMLRHTGPEWDLALPMNKQTLWHEHAVFSNELEASGFVVLGGPLDDIRVVLAVEAESEEVVRETLAKDPWANTHLVVDSIELWDCVLDSRYLLVEGADPSQ
jgi:hypothetical protein